MDPQKLKLIIDAVCKVTPDRMTLDIARYATMKRGGNAWRHLNHYLDGNGADLTVDLQKVLAEDEGVRRLIHTTLYMNLGEGKSSGTIPISQSAYKNKDWHFAIGGMNIEWKWISGTQPNPVEFKFRNKYRWHPQERRITQCIHQAADDLKVKGAADYFMKGQTRITVSVREWENKLPAGPVKTEEYRVASGDSLSKIAERYYGKSAEWGKIYDQNRGRIGPNPKLIHPGQTLLIPV